MKITVLQQDLLPVLQSVYRSTGVRSTLPVLANILIQAEKAQVILSATNLEIGITKQLKAEIEEEGALSVPAKMLLEIISTLTPTKITLESLNDQLKINSSNFKATLNGISASEFPAIPYISDQTFFIDINSLKDCLPKIIFAASSDEGRPVLTGILTHLQKHTLKLVSTDGFRLAYKEIKLNGENEFKALIPRRTFEEIVKLIDEDSSKNIKEEKIKIGISENQNQIIFQINNTKLSSRLIEGQFPSWEKIIPSKFENKTIIDKNQFLKAIKLASVFARDLSSVVKIQTQKDQIKVSSENKQLGDQETLIEAQTEGKDILIAYNSKFLIDVLSVCSSGSVSVEFSGSLSPTLMKPVGEDGLEYIIMPVRLN